MRGASLMLSLVLLVLPLGACTSDAQTGDDADLRTGTLANAEQREVGIFYFPLDGSQGRCTATLIGPQTAITAAHCVLPTSGAGACTGGSVYFDTAGSGGALDQRVKVGVRACATPVNNVTSLLSRKQDIAVLALSRKVTEVTKTASIATSAPNSSAKVTVYGYGRTGATCTAQNAAQKFRAVVTFGDDTSPTCKGDSGGPYFRGDGRSLTHEIVALVSGETTNEGLRVTGDPIANRAWIEARRAESEAGRSLTDAR